MSDLPVQMIQIRNWTTTSRFCTLLRLFIQKFNHLNCCSFSLEDLPKMLTWCSKQQFFVGCFSWMIPNLYIKNVCLHTKCQKRHNFQCCFFPWQNMRMALPSCQCQTQFHHSVVLRSGEDDGKETRCSRIKNQYKDTRIMKVEIVSDQRKFRRNYSE